ncbi:MAG: hypothetical protein QOF65_2576, partial [Thermoleophilaceae bacterium]|nr:hypothetical protein [Thermoleophilaceae bacterium]
MRNYIAPTLAALAAAAATAGLAVANESHGSQSSYSIGLWGDLPYSDIQKSNGVPNLVADMNSQRLAFTVHDGDLKSGSSPCTDSVYTDAKATLNSLEAPA